MDSAILNSTTHVPVLTQPKLSSRDTDILNLLDAEITNKGVHIPNLILNNHVHLKGMKCICLKDWQASVYLYLDSFNIKDPSKYQAFKRAKDELIKLNKIGTEDGIHFWINP